MKNARISALALCVGMGIGKSFLRGYNLFFLRLAVVQKTMLKLFLLPLSNLLAPDAVVRTLIKNISHRRHLLTLS